MKKMSVILLTLLILPSLAFAHGMSEADQIRAVGGDIGEFFRQGAMHMITGYDHLLFLFGVIFFLTKFKDIVKFVTAFTLGHSITLIAATFMGISADYYLVDAVIALTVCYKGFDNLGGFKKYFNMKSPNLVAMVFIFGLIHGFGLSTRLQTLTIGGGMDLLGKIVAFNVGVEAGQIIALVIMLALLAGVRHGKSFQRFSTAANALLIILGGLLFLMQLHGYTHKHGGPAEFYPLQDHQHAHEDLGLAGGGGSIRSGSPAVYRVDESGDESGGGHSHGAADKFDPLVTRIFEARKQYTSARSDEDVLRAVRVLPDIFEDLLLLRNMLAVIPYLDFKKIDQYLTDAGEVLGEIDNKEMKVSADSMRERIQRFDTSVLAIEDLVNHPVLPEGYHVDEQGGSPHKH